MQASFDLFSYLALAFLALSFLVAALLVCIIPENQKDNLEVRKLRFSAVLFTGIMIVFLFFGMLYFANPTSGAAKEIFEKAVTSMTPLAGAIMGYIFGSGKGANESPSLS